MTSISTTDPSTQRRILHPGDFYLTRKPMTLSTLLGSCVSVCLYDPVERVMGMNHFLLADRHYAAGEPVLGTEAGRYGIHAMELLINGALKLGAKRMNLRAKAFGGGNVLSGSNNDDSSFFSVGSVNVRFVREFLKKDGIPIVAADLGGSMGRQIRFTGSDFAVYVKPIAAAGTQTVLEQERQYWRESVEKHEHPKRDVDFW